MSYARRCDRCGKFYDTKLSLRSTYSAGLVLRKHDSTGSYTVKDQLDICPDCLSKLEAFFREENGECNTYLKQRFIEAIENMINNEVETK